MQSGHSCMTWHVLLPSSRRVYTYQPHVITMRTWTNHPVSNNSISHLHTSSLSHPHKAQHVHTPASSSCGWEDQHTQWFSDLHPITRLMGFPGGSDGKESACNAGGLFHPGVKKIPWRRAWQPTPVFLPGESRTEEPGGLQFMGLQRVRHDWATNTFAFTRLISYRDVIWTQALGLQNALCYKRKRRSQAAWEEPPQGSLSGESSSNPDRAAGREQQQKKARVPIHPRA